MFSLKSKSKQVAQVAQVVKQAFETPKDPNVIVAEIHEAFDSATDRLLKEAKKILAEEKNVEKGERLMSLGFNYAKSAQEAQQEKSKTGWFKEVAKNIEYYQSHYPNNKFITEEVVAGICKKYGLLCGFAYWYVGEVPDKNLSEIELFKLRKEDGKPIIQEYPHEGKVHKYYYKYNIYNNSSHVDVTDVDCTDLYEPKLMKICASVSDFSEHYLKNIAKVEDGYRLVANIPDPIVLQPVNGGYLIISKWGLEGNDESLTNEKRN